MIKAIKRFLDVDGKHTDRDPVWSHIEANTDDDCLEPGELRRLTTQAIEIQATVKP